MFFGLIIWLLFTDLFLIRFQIRIGSGSGQKFRILTDPVPDPQQWVWYRSNCQFNVFLCLQGADGRAGLRQKYLSRAQDNKATVKGLIESIESAAKAHYTRSSSTPTMPTLSPISENPAKPPFVSSSPAPICNNKVISISHLKRKLIWLY
jgi:hypothetical protein